MYKKIMNVIDWKIKIQEVLAIHNSEINEYYRSHNKIKQSLIKYNLHGKKKIFPAEEVHHSDTLSSKVFKKFNGDNNEIIDSYIVTQEKNCFTFQTELKYFSNVDIFLTQTLEKNSGILLHENFDRGCIVGGSPTFRYGMDESRWYWNELLDKDVHFNQCICNKLLSYETYLVMYEIYPYVPHGTLLTVKELFNE